MGCRWIDETEDELRAMGHLASEEDERHFTEEVVLDTYACMGMNQVDLLYEMAGRGGDDEDSYQDFINQMGM